MIPKNINQRHVFAAFAEIDRVGTPDQRVSRKFTLEYNGRQYSPKYVVSLANRYANGTELSSSVFNGGAETNNFLRSLDFTVNKLPTLKGGSATSQQGLKAPPQNAAKPLGRPPGRSSTTSPLAVLGSPAIAAAVKSRHTGERCKDCKRVVKALLEKIYGTVHENYPLNLKTRPEDFSHALCQPILGKIFSALQLHRGFKEFIRMAVLPRCDFYVPKLDFLVEFDESQHFSELRRLALSLYPTELQFGFDVAKWMNICEEVHARDNDPPYRDEQRAWYDTLRDFTPIIKGMPPTVRLHSRDRVWCSLDPTDKTDVETFRQIVGEYANFWRLDYRIPNKAPLARIAIDGAWRGDIRLAKKLLQEICQGWPSDVRVHCLSTCGAFIGFDWPEAMPKQEDNRFPTDGAVEILDAVARDQVKRLLSDGLRESLAKFSNYLTIGVDSKKSLISSTDAHIPSNHAELVYVVNLKTGDTHFTGKSYPTSNQEKGLFRILNLDSHFITLDGVSTMVLGCHDLTIFNPRSDATALGWRSQTKKDFKEHAKSHAPRWVLHHPHTAVKQRTWSHGWNGLRAELPSVTSYLGTGCYSFRDSKSKEKRSPLQSVLDSTKSPDVADIIVHLGAIPCF